MSMEHICYAARFCPALHSIEHGGSQLCNCTNSKNINWKHLKCENHVVKCLKMVPPMQHHLNGLNKKKGELNSWKF